MLVLQSAQCFAQQITFTRKWVGLNSGSDILDVAVKGEAGYMLRSNGVDVVDLSDPNRPHIISHIDLPHKGTPHMRRTADDTLLLVYDKAFSLPIPAQQLSVISIAEPLAPRLVATIYVPGIVDGDVKDNILYASKRFEDGDNLLVPIDISHLPEKTYLIGEISTGLGFGQVHVVGSRVYAQEFPFDSENYNVYDIQPDGGIQKLGFWPPPFAFSTAVAFSDSLAAFITDGGWDSNDNFYLYHITSEGGFQFICSYNLFSDEYRVTDVAFLNSATPDGPQLVVRAERNVGVTMEQTLLTARIVGDSTLEVLGKLDVGRVRDNVEQFAADGTTLFWSNLTSVGVGHIDSRGAPERDGGTSVGWICNDVAGVSRDRIYAVTTDSLRVLDFSDPAHPEFLSSFPLRAEGVTVLNEERIITFDSVVTLLDVSNPRAPRLLDTLNLGHKAIGWRAVVRDSLIVVCCLDGGTFVLVARRDSLHNVCRIAARSTNALWLEDGRLLLTTLDAAQGVWDKLQVFDSRYDWCAPERMQVYGKPGQGIVSAGDTIIVATGGALLFLNAAVNGAPELVQSHSVYEEPMAGISYQDGLIYVQSIHTDKGMYHWDRNGGSVSRVGHWDGVGSGNGRFFFVDTLLMFSVELFRTLEVWQFNTTIADVKSDTHGQGAINAGIGIQVVPNIIRDRCTVNISLPKATYVRLNLYDATGHEIRTVFTQHCEAGKHELKMDVSNLAEGFYFLQLTSDSGTAVQQFLRVR